MLTYADVCRRRGEGAERRGSAHKEDALGRRRQQHIRLWNLHRARASPGLLVLLYYCFTTALLLLYCCVIELARPQVSLKQKICGARASPGLSLLLYYCFTTALLLLYYCYTSRPPPLEPILSLRVRMCLFFLKVKKQVSLKKKTVLSSRVHRFLALLLYYCFTTSLLLLYYIFTTGAWVRSEVPCIRWGAVACLRQRR